MKQSIAIVACCVAMTAGAATQSAPAGRIVIMPMANTSKPADLDFQGGTCDVASSGRSMTCSFQQVFLTPVPEDPTTCRIVTNRYQETFTAVDDRHWIDTAPPDGPCGIVAQTTIERDEKSLAAFWRVTMTVKKIVTHADAGAQCTGETPADTLSSTTTRRALGCTYVVPGSLEF